MYKSIKLILFVFLSIIQINNNILYANNGKNTFGIKDSCTIKGKVNSFNDLSYDNEFKFRPKQLIVPGIFIVAGSFGVCNSGWFHKNINIKVKDGLESWRGDKRFKYDDYMQYVPLVAHLGLSLCGVEAKTSYKERIAVIATSYIALGIMVNGTKYTVKKLRPDGSKKNSFVSGHTATVFMGAELVRSEYKDASPWYGIGAYTLAAGVGFLRLYNNRHWVSDVIAGAGVGILSARIGYWLLPFEKKLFGWDKKDKPALVAVPYYQPDTKSIGASFSMAF